jgi:hypothetical protein
MKRRFALRALASSILAIVMWCPSASAKPAAPWNCTVPDWIRVVGAVDGGRVADPYGLATIVVRDAFNNPEAGSDVRLDFSACCDLRLCGGYMNGVWVDAAAGTVTGRTDAYGKLSFVILGAATSQGACGSGCSSPGGSLGCVRVDASAGTGYIEIRRPAGVALDQDGADGAPGAGGVSGADVACVIRNVGAALLSSEAYRARSDLNQDGALTAVDVSEMIAQLGRLALIGGVGCARGAYSEVPACP